MIADRQRFEMSSGLRLGVGLALLALVALALLPAAPGDRSTLDRGPNGSAALAGTLQRLGLSVHSMRVGLRPLREQPDGSVLVVVLASGLLQSPAFTRSELRWVLEFVTRGNTLLFAVNRQHPLLDALSLNYQHRNAAERGSVSDSSRDAARARAQAFAVLPEQHSLYGELSVADGGSLGLADSSFEALYGVDDRALVARARWGTGQVFVVADPFTLSNEGLGEGANVAFYSGLISASLGAGGVVLFDDLHAGASPNRGMVTYARRQGFSLSLLLVLLLALCSLWRGGVRLGHIRPARSHRRTVADAEMVHAVGSLYERAGLADHALEVLSARLEEAVQVRSGLHLEHAADSLWAQDLGEHAVGELRWLHQGLIKLKRQDKASVPQVLRWARRSQRFQAERIYKRAVRSRV